jgi:hypothetical protein
LFEACAPSQNGLFCGAPQRHNVMLSCRENGAYPERPYIVSGNVPVQTQTIITDAVGESESWLPDERFAASILSITTACWEFVPGGLLPLRKDIGVRLSIASD